MTYIYILMTTPNITNPQLGFVCIFTHDTSYYKWHYCLVSAYGSAAIWARFSQYKTLECIYTMWFFHMFFQYLFQMTWILSNEVVICTTTLNTERYLIQIWNGYVWRLHIKEHLFFATFSSYLMEIIWLASSLYLDFPSRLHPT